MWDYGANGACRSPLHGCSVTIEVMEHHGPSVIFEVIVVHEIRLIKVLHDEVRRLVWHGSMRSQPHLAVEVDVSATDVASAGCADFGEVFVAAIRVTLEIRFTVYVMV